MMKSTVLLRREYWTAGLISYCRDQQNIESSPAKTHTHTLIIDQPSEGAAQHVIKLLQHLLFEVFVPCLNKNLGFYNSGKLFSLCYKCSSLVQISVKLNSLFNYLALQLSYQCSDIQPVQNNCENNFTLLDYVNIFNFYKRIIGRHLDIFFAHPSCYGNSRARTLSLFTDSSCLGNRKAFCSYFGETDFLFIHFF